MSQNKCQDWLDDAKTYGGPLVRPPCPALHVVLNMRSGELEAIRAFVERVEKRAKLVSVSKFHYAELIEDELAALEKETNAEKN